MSRLVQTGLDVCFNVQTVTKSWGKEITWKIGCHDESCEECVSISEDGEKYDNHAEYNQECCLPEKQQSFLVKCSDSYGDGWNDGYIEIHGKRYCNDFLDKYEEESIPNEQVPEGPG